MTSTLILGGGYGGSLAAVRLARRGVPVTLVDAGTGLVDRIRLHQAAVGDDIPITPYSRIFRGLPVEVVRARVTGIDRERKLVHTSSGDLHYDRMLYTLGSTSPVLGISQNAKTVAVIGA